jgi:predicted RNase H-related nuclease YkuK (DUF458 family)
MVFVSPTRGKMELSEVLSDLDCYIQEDPTSEYKIIIGTDSQTDNKSTTFVTAIILRRVGMGARFYFIRKPSNPIKDLTYRIYSETDFSLRLVHDLERSGLSAKVSQCPIEIHLDVGPNGETRKLIKEVVGWVTSVGYKAIIKPDAYGASSVADRYTKW